MNKKMSLISVGVALLVGACASDKTVDAKKVASQEIVRTYYASYNEGKKEVTLLAQARVGNDRGDTVVFTPPAGFRAENKILPPAKPPVTREATPEEVEAAKKLTNEQIGRLLTSSLSVREIANPRRQGTYYERTDQAPAMASHYTFEYLSEKGEKDSVKVSMPPAIKPLLEKDTWKAGDSFMVAWEGAPLTKEEEIDVKIEVSTPTGTFSITSLVKQGAGQKFDVKKEIETLAIKEEVQRIAVSFNRIGKNSEFLSKPLVITLKK